MCLKEKKSDAYLIVLADRLFSIFFNESNLIVVGKMAPLTIIEGNSCRLENYHSFKAI